MKAALFAVTVLASGAMAASSTSASASASASDSASATAASSATVSSGTTASNTTSDAIYDYNLYPACADKCAQEKKFDDCISKAGSDDGAINQCRKDLRCPNLNDIATCEQCVLNNVKNDTSFNRAVYAGFMNGIFDKDVKVCKALGVDAQFTELTSSATRVAAAGSVLVAVGVAAAALF